MKVAFLKCWQENYPEEGPELTCAFLDDIERIKRVYNRRTLNDASVDCYVHNEQHVNASYGYLKAGVPATVEEYTPLLKELYAVDYDKNSIEVCQDFKF